LVKYSKTEENTPEDNKKCQMTKKLPNGYRMYQNFPLQGLAKHTQINFFWFENISYGNPG
jgi:hypothetical protein